MEVDNRVEEFLYDFKQNEVEICKRANCLPEKWKAQIFEYEKKWRMDSLSLPADFFSKNSFEDTYTFDHWEWNCSCIVGENEPSALINFVLITDKHIGLSFKHGGYGISKFFKVFVIEDGIVSNHWTRWMESSKLRDLTYELLEVDFEILK